MIRDIPVERAGTSEAHCRDRVVIEEPLEVRVGGQSLVVTMRTPGHDEELAAGLLFTEGVIGAEDIVGVATASASADEHVGGTVAVVKLRDGASFDAEPMRRGILASSSCGVCGKWSLEQIRRRVTPVESGWAVDVELLKSLPLAMRAEQRVFDATGGLHAAGLFDGDGRLVCLREDIGRHNAVDKVIGWAVLSDSFPLGRHVLLVSGRASYEIVFKALAARIPVVAAISAVSSLAIEMARAGGQTLVGFLRDGLMTIYCRGG